MFLGCSEISISVIVKHEQHIGIIMVFCPPRTPLVAASVCPYKRRKSY